jgi:hypothetical protein
VTDHDTGDVGDGIVRTGRQLPDRKAKMPC